MSIVTVQGAHSLTYSLNLDTGANAALAQQIANAINFGIANITRVDNSFNATPGHLASGSSDGEFGASVPSVTIMPKGFDAAVGAGSLFNVFLSTDPNQNAVAGSGIFNVTAASGTSGGNIAAGSGNDTIVIPAANSGAWNIALGNGSDTIRALGGGNDTIVSGAGSNVIALGGGNNVVTTSGAATVTATSGHATVTATAGTDVINPGGSVLTFIGTAGSGATVTAGAGSATIIGGSGSDVFYGGAAGNNSIVAGTGVATVTGGGNGDTLVASGSSNQILFAGSGNETLIGSGAGGADTFVGGSGTAAIYGGSATISTFEFLSGTGPSTDTVFNLTNVNQIKIHLASLTVTNGGGFGAVSGSDLGITLSDGTSVTFKNVSSILTNTNFV